MKKRILFCVRDFNHGGIPKCLQQLLLFIDQDIYEIDVFCGDQRGPYHKVFSSYNVIKQNYFILLCMMNFRKEKGVTRIFAILVKLFRHILLSFRIDILKKMLVRKARSYKGYHAAIAYAEGFPVDFIEHIDCNNKIIWIHSNYQWSDSSEQDMLKKEVLYKFNKVVCVAKHIADAFIEKYPYTENKVITINNLIADQEIIELSSSIEPLHPLFDNSNFTMLSIGRIAHPKDFDKIPQIVHSLKKMGMTDIKWYIIGPGPDIEVQKVIDNIHKYEVENEVILLGAIMNPYVYITKSDLYVLTSQSEAYPTVINEAKILGTPIVSTNFNGVNEIMSKKYGIIESIEKLHIAIYKIYSDNDLYKQYKENLNHFHQDNNRLLNKIYTLLCDREDLNR